MHDGRFSAMCFVYMNEDVPATSLLDRQRCERLCIQGNLCSIASVLSADHKKALNMGIKTKYENEALATYGSGASACN